VLTFSQRAVYGTPPRLCRPRAGPGLSAPYAYQQVGTNYTVERSAHLCATLLRGPVDARAVNAPSLGNSRGGHRLSFHLAHLSRIDRSRPALIDAFGLGFRNALKLALMAKVCFELSIHAQHVEEVFAVAVAVEVSIGRSEVLRDAPWL
jgi:hypothetical protein